MITMADEQVSKNVVENLCQQETSLIRPDLTGIPKGNERVQNLFKGDTL